ncbi:hypothetical protein CBM2587_B90527 [Cupriavidus taiwanensis]|uniref:Uncharacterized protein n=1 Tax=Cupriavidus taiwanensis TaxID=164546 RepID=A0A975XEY8_9BURK|nr:hypothetical protein CBM2587_B90527 [Cupriavidus taiwanensis]
MVLWRAPCITRRPAGRQASGGSHPVSAPAEYPSAAPVHGPKSDKKPGLFAGLSGSSLADHCHRAGRARARARANAGNHQTTIHSGVRVFSLQRNVSNAVSRAVSRADDQGGQHRPCRRAHRRAGSGARA